jgi:hypothetical protein
VVVDGIPSWLTRLEPTTWNIYGGITRMESLKQAVKQQLQHQSVAESTHTSGRRELLAELRSLAHRTFYRDDPEHPGKQLPVKRAERRRPAGISARQWKKLRDKGKKREQATAQEAARKAAEAAAAAAQPESITQ